jgi:hypothetical protein
MPSGSDRGPRSLTRGLNSRCGDQIKIATYIRRTEAGIELRWEPFIGAIKYRVFVSDLDERLIDEFETADKTVHVVTAHLDPNTRYEWKLLVELKDGRTLVGASRNFTATVSVDGRNPKVTSATEGLRPIAILRCMEKK